MSDGYASFDVWSAGFQAEGSFCRQGNVWVVDGEFAVEASMAVGGVKRNVAVVMVVVVELVDFPVDGNPWAAVPLEPSSS